MSQLSLKKIKLGDNADTSKNFVISVPAVADGTLTVERENGTDVIAVATTGAVNLSGTNTNDSAPTGVVGEYISVLGGGTVLTSGSQISAASISLTAGDWDVSGEVSYPSATTHTLTRLKQGVSTVNNTFDANSFTASIFPGVSYNPSSTGPIRNATPTTRVSLSTTTTVYIVVQSEFTTAGLTAVPFIRARRVR